MAINIILWDGTIWQNHLPLTYTRPISQLRIGILTITEKHEKYFEGADISYITEPYLQNKFPVKYSTQNLVINSAVLPDEKIVSEIKKLNPGESIWQGTHFLAGNFSQIQTEILVKEGISPAEKSISYEYNVSLLLQPWQIFTLAGEEISKDFKLLTHGRQSAPIHSSNYIKNPENIFLEPGAIVENASLNASSGPIYLAKDSEIMEGAMVRGPFALGEHSQLKLGAKIYGATSIGPHCKIGGEVSNSVFIGYANKGHDGFVGNAVIGEWCNLGADTNNSNLKNNYEEVKIWNYKKGGFLPTGLQFCGLFMGDHSKTGINTMLNTGTVIGVSSNIFGSGFPRNFVPSFSWGGASGFTTYKVDKAIETAKRVMERRKIELSKNDEEIFSHIFEHEQAYRNF